jgi:hypothetical protein
MITPIEKFKLLSTFKENSAFFEAVFAKHQFLIKNENGFLIYLYENFTETGRPVLKDVYAINKNVSNPFEPNKLPAEMKRQPMINALILPKTISNNRCTIWAGHKVAPMMGHGTKEIWEFARGKWQCTNSRMTWHS